MPRCVAAAPCANNSTAWRSLQRVLHFKRAHPSARRAGELHLGDMLPELPREQQVEQLGALTAWLKVTNPTQPNNPTTQPLWKPAGGGSRVCTGRHAARARLPCESPAMATSLLPHSLPPPPPHPHPPPTTRTPPAPTPTHHHTHTTHTPSGPAARAAPPGEAQRQGGARASCEDAAGGAAAARPRAAGRRAGERGSHAAAAAHRCVACAVAGVFVSRGHPCEEVKVHPCVACTILCTPLLGHFPLRLNNAFPACLPCALQKRAAWRRRWQAASLTSATAWPPSPASARPPLARAAPSWGRTTTLWRRVERD